MLFVLARLCWVALTLLPLALALALLVPRFWRSVRPSEGLLVVTALVPLILLIEIHSLGHWPGRPLDFLPLLHAAVCVLALIFCWRNRHDARRLAEITRSRTASFGLLPLPQRALLFTGLLWYLAVGFIAAWNLHLETDALGYHLPQALQPFVDGRLGPVEAPFMWADTFPRTANLLRFWALALGGGDASFNALSFAAASVFMLAVYVGARRLAVRRFHAALLALTVPTTPIVIHLCINGNIDLEAHCMVAAAAAFALPRRGRLPCLAAFTCGLLALVLAFWIKFVTIGMGGAVGVFMLLLTLAGGVRERQLVRRVLLGCLAIALALLPYLSTWVRFGSPLYPIQLKIGPWTIFEGPLSSSEIALRNEHVLERSARTWTEWFTPFTSDSPGSLGPLFGWLMIPALALVTVAAILQPRRAVLFGWALAAMVLACALFLPQQHVPRFGLSILFAGSVALVMVYNALAVSPFRKAAPILVLLLALWNVGRWWQNFDRDVLAPSAARGGDLFSADRNGFLLRELRQGPASPTPALREFARSVMAPGQTLITAVEGAPFLWMDSAFSFAVKHRPITPWPVSFSAPPPPDNQPQAAGTWLATLRSDPRVVLVAVYAGWPEDLAIAQADSGFSLAMEQDRSAGPMVIRLYRRR